MTKIKTLNELLEMQIQDLYDAENQIIKSLPEVIEKCTNESLKSALKEHLEVTKNQIERLKEVAENLDYELEGKPCNGMKGVLKEAEETIKEVEEGNVLDAALIGDAQRVEHYEIAGYGTAIALAQLLEHDDEADLLTETLEEEKEADETLTNIAESEINTEEE